MESCDDWKSSWNDNDDWQSAEQVCPSATSKSFHTAHPSFRRRLKIAAGKYYYLCNTITANQHAVVVISADWMSSQAPRSCSLTNKNFASRAMWHIVNAMRCRAPFWLFASGRRRADVQQRPMKCNSRQVVTCCTRNIKGMSQCCCRASIQVAGSAKKRPVVSWKQTNGWMIECRQRQAHRSRPVVLITVTYFLMLHNEHLYFCNTFHHQYHHYHHQKTTKQKENRQEWKEKKHLFERRVWMTDRQLSKTRHFLNNAILTWRGVFVLLCERSLDQPNPNKNSGKE